MRVALQFHPDWPFRGELVVEALARDGVYRSQFETGTSNGGLTAHPEDDRWRWESRLFAGRYDGRPAADRPVYGAVPTGPRGGAPRFGSAHLRLREDVVERTTFCYPDSVFEPTEHGGPVEAAAAAAGPVEWHPGFRVRTAHLDPAYRGPEAVALARSWGDELTPDVVGAAARSGAHDPQRVKHVWHLLARFG